MTLNFVLLFFTTNAFKIQRYKDLNTLLLYDGHVFNFCFKIKVKLQNDTVLKTKESIRVKSNKFQKLDSDVI